MLLLSLTRRWSSGEVVAYWQLCIDMCCLATGNVNCDFLCFLLSFSHKVAKGYVTAQTKGVHLMFAPVTLLFDPNQSYQVLASPAFRIASPKALLWDQSTK